MSEPEWIALPRGCGKTTQLVRRLAQALAAGDKCVVLDRHRDMERQIQLSPIASVYWSSIYFPTDISKLRGLRHVRVFVDNFDLYDYKDQTRILLLTEPGKVVATRTSAHPMTWVGSRSAIWHALYK